MVCTSYALDTFVMSYRSQLVALGSIASLY